jgi:hypothetical protein
MYQFINTAILIHTLLMLNEYTPIIYIPNKNFKENMENKQ